MELQHWGVLNDSLVPMVRVSPVVRLDLCLHCWEQPEVGL
jgi:hypothetical protein